MLDEGPFHPEVPAALLAFKNVSERVEVLVERLLGPEGPIALLAIENVSGHGVHICNLGK
jgi:hypothetical protein